MRVVERICITHAYFSFAVGILLYFQPLKEAIKLMGVAHETAHSLRNTGLLLFFVAYISAAVKYELLRKIPTTIGKYATSRNDEGLLENFVTGLVIITNSALLIHYSFESFYYDAIAQTPIIILWVMTIAAFFGFKFVVHVDGIHIKGM